MANKATIEVYGIDLDMAGKGIEQLVDDMEWMKPSLEKAMMMPPDRIGSEVWHVCFMTESERDGWLKANEERYRIHGYAIKKTEGTLRTLKSALGEMA